MDEFVTEELSKQSELIKKIQEQFANYNSAAQSISKTLSINVIEYRKMKEESRQLNTLSKIFTENQLVQQNLNQSINDTNQKNIEILKRESSNFYNTQFAELDKELQYAERNKKYSESKIDALVKERDLLSKQLLNEKISGDEKKEILNTINKIGSSISEQKTDSEEIYNTQKKLIQSKKDQLITERELDDLFRDSFDDTIKSLKEQLDITEAQKLKLDQLIKKQELINQKTEALKGSFGNIVPMIEEIFGLLRMIAMNPLAAILVLLALAVKRFIELDSASEELSKTTGLLQSQIGYLKKDVENLSKEYAKFGVSTSDVVKAQNALLESTNDNKFAVKETTKDVVLMSNRLGIAEEDSAKILQTFQGMSGSSSQTATALAYQTAELAKQSGLAPKKIFQDISKSSEATLKYMRGNTTQLIKATIEARRFGTSLSAVSASADSLLDFESSINKEAELSALLGKNVNLQKMRQLAYDGDLGALAEEQSKFLKEQGGLLGKNAFQVKAMAEATGMTVDEMTKMSQQTAIQDDMQKQLAEYNTKAAAGDLVAAAKAKEINEYVQEQKNAAEKLKKLKEGESKFDLDSLRAKAEEERITGEMTKMQQELNSIMLQFGSLFLPLIKLIIPTVSIITKKIAQFAPILGNILEFVGNIIAGAVQLSIPLYQAHLLMTSFLKPLILSIGNLTKISNIFSSWAGLLTLPFKIITGGIGLFGKLLEGIAVIGKQIVPAIEFLVTKFFKLFEFIPFIGKFLGSFGKLVPGIGQVITILQALWSAGVRIFDIFGDVFKGDFISAFKKSVDLVPGIIYDVILSPFVDAFKWIWGTFKDKLPNGIVSGIESVGAEIEKYLKAPFDTGWKAISGWFGHSPSELGLNIVNGIKSVAGMLFDVLSTPFKMVWDFIGDLFGMNNLGTMIVDTFKKIAPMIFDFLISPFSMLLKFIPDFLKPKSSEKLVSNSQPNENVQQLSNNTVQSSPTNVEVTSKTNTNDQLIVVLNQLSELLKNGITVEMDGEKVTRIITNRVVSQNM